MEEKKRNIPAIFAILNSLSESNCITKDVVGPLLALGQHSNDYQFLEQFTGSIFGSLASKLSEQLNRGKINDKKVKEIFNKLMPWIDEPKLARVFDAIASKNCDEDMHMMFRTIDPKNLFSTFGQNALKKIFEDNEIFDKCLIWKVSPLDTDYLSMDALVFPPVCDRVNVQLQSVHDKVIGELANDIVGNMCSQLQNYQRACKIIEDIWVRTRNPLFAALRLELSQKAEKSGKYRDEMKEVCNNFYTFLNSYKLPPISLRPEAYIFANDPIVKSLLVKLLFINLNKPRVITNKPPYFDEGVESSIRALIPGAKIKELQDIVNYLIAMKISAEYSFETTEIIHRIMGVLQAIENGGPDHNVQLGIAASAATSIMCVAAKFAETGLIPFVTLIETIAKSKYANYPDASVTLMLLYHMTALDMIDEVINMLIRWSATCPLTATFLYLFIDDANDRGKFIESIGQWLVTLKKQRPEYGKLPPVPLKISQKLEESFGIEASEDDEDDDDDDDDD